MSSKRTYGDRCGIARALDLVGERWALLVVRELLLGPKRFTDLRAGLPHVGPDVLSQRLRELERAGIVCRRILAPPAASRVYELTEWGQELEPVVLGLGRWGSRSPVPGDDAVFGPDSAALALKTLFAPARPPTSTPLSSCVWAISGSAPGSAMAASRSRAESRTARTRSSKPTRAPSPACCGTAAASDRPCARASWRCDGDRVLADAFLRLFPLPEASREGTAAARGHQR